jgi:hypothetical protein
MPEKFGPSVFLTDDEIKASFEKAEPAEASQAGFAKFSYTTLDPTSFEWLLYALFSKPNIQKHLLDYSDARVMSEGADRGRDIVLYSEFKPRGIIQCKRYSSAISRPSVLREVIKYLLFAELDNDLIPNVENFTYVLALSSDPAETVADLFHEPVRVLNEIDEDIESYIREVIETFETLKPLNQVSSLVEIKRRLRLIKLKLLRPVDLDDLISRTPSVQARFFGARLVTDSILAEALMKQSAQVEGLLAQFAPVLDNDVTALKARIDGVPEHYRMSTGAAKLFGFPHEIAKDKLQFQKLLDCIGRSKRELDRFFLDWINQEAKDRAASVSQSIDVALHVHPFALQIPVPFLSMIAIDCVVQTENGDGPFGIIMRGPGYKKRTDDELMEYIVGRLLENGAKVVNGNFSDYSEPPHLFETKKQIVIQAAAGLRSREDVELHLRRGAATMRAALNDAAVEIRRLAKYSRTIVIQNMGSLDMPGELQRMFDVVKAAGDNKNAAGTKIT